MVNVLPVPGVDGAGLGLNLCVGSQTDTRLASKSTADPATWSGSAESVREDGRAALEPEVPVHRTCQLAQFCGGVGIELARKDVVVRETQSAESAEKQRED
jgi:hypothetical protein